jgi:hypothetical protein
MENAGHECTVPLPVGHPEIVEQSEDCRGQLFHLFRLEGRRNNPLVEICFRKDQPNQGKSPGPQQLKVAHRILALLAPTFVLLSTFMATTARAPAGQSEVK